MIAATIRSPCCGASPAWWWVPPRCLRLPPLPALSLVALTLFDTHLALADFRAEEEALRMLLELGELSRQRRPLVLVQTYQPEHPVLKALATDPPDAAVEVLVGRLLERRRRFAYPPFGALAKLQLAARDRGAASEAASALAEELRRRGAKEDEVLGPAPAPVARLKGRYAYQVLVAASGRRPLGADPGGPATQDGAGSVACRRRSQGRGRAAGVRGAKSSRVNERTWSRLVNM